jgi:putative ABC transport system substrate-binding protein
MNRSKQASMGKKAIGFLLVSLVLVSVYPAEAQPQKVWKLGIFTSSSSPVTALRLEGLRQGLGELGYVEGQNIIIEHRNAGAKPHRYPEIAAELVRLKADVIVVTGELPVFALKQTTQTIPIVMLSIGADPVEAGFVESLARPGGNITGFTNVGQELGGKRLELFKEVVPRVARIAVLYEPTNPSNVLEVKGVQTAAAALKLTVQPSEVRDADSFERVFTALNQQRLDGLYVSGGPLMNANEKRTVDFALRSRLPSVYLWSTAVSAGGLMAYGASLTGAGRDAARYVDRILKGAKPADLPVQQPTKFELVINLKTAKQIGLTIPPNVLARADKVIK